MKRIGRKLIYSILAMLLIASALAFGCAKPAPTGPIVLKAVGFLPPTHPHTIKWLHFADMVKEKTNGELTINYLGGAEVISMNDAPLALQAGTFDIILTGDTFYKSLVPAAASTGGSKITMAEERKAGYVTLMQKIHEKSGFYYVGRGAPSGGPEFYLFLNTKTPPTKLDDLKGLKIASLMGVSGALQKLGMTQVSMASAEVYTALERGVCQGYVGSITGVTPRGYQEVLKNAVDHAYLSQSMITLMNLDSWKRLPKNLQDKLNDAQVEYEPWSEKELMKEFAAERDKLTKAGIQFVKFSPDEATKFVNTFYEDLWQWVLEKDPANGPKLKEMLFK